MHRFDGTAARQLHLIEPDRPSAEPHRVHDRPRASMRLLRRDVYAELERRRRRAQIAARHLADSEN